MQCKDIPDEPVLRFLSGPFNDWPVPGWGTWFWADDYKPSNSVANAMPAGTPEKLVADRERAEVAGTELELAQPADGDLELARDGRGREPADALVPGVRDEPHPLVGPGDQLFSEAQDLLWS